MGVKSVPVTQCAPGDIVARDVENSHGVIVIVRNTTLNVYIINKLKAFGVSQVVIYDRAEGDADQSGCPAFSAFCDDYYQTVMGMKRIITGLVAGEDADHGLVQQVSDAIYGTIEHAGSIASFIQVLKSSDEYTYTHCANTAYYAMLMGKWLGFSRSEIKMLIQSGLLHDIGKVRIPLELLNKRGVLTRDEYEIVKKHTIWGYGIVEEAGVTDPDVRKAVLLHHERVDGSGYPFGAQADYVNVPARIVAVADVFDAMTSDRPYKQGATPFKAFEMFSTVGAGVFDTSVMNTFVKNLASNYVGANVKLNNGERGKLVHIPPHDVLSPIVAIGDKYVDLSASDLEIAAML